jgi:uncharacterized protein
MGTEVFVDTGGFFALLSPHDPWHAKANRALKQAPANQLLVTTDYVLDETATLLRTRRQPHLVEPWFRALSASGHFHIVWMDEQRFDEVRRFFTKHSDKEWSFTDCFSFCVMKERKIGQALAADQHFTQAGFQLLLS